MEHFRNNPADLCVVAGWYHMLPSRLRDLFRLGAVGLYASRLPELRGGAPLNWAILAGFERTAVTRLRWEMVLTMGRSMVRKPLTSDRTTISASWWHRCNAASVVLVERCISGILTVRLSPLYSDGVASYGAQRSPEDGVIDMALAAG